MRTTDQRLRNQAAKWPTPATNPQAPNKNSNMVNGPTSLQEAALGWPTPKANDAEKNGDVAQDPRNGLMGAANHWQTPRASEAKGGSYQRDGHQSGKERLSLTGEAAEWPTPNTPNGGRTQSEEEVRAKGATPRGKRQVGLESATRFWPGCETSESNANPAKTTEPTSKTKTDGTPKDIVPPSTVSEESSQTLWPTPKALTGGANSNREERETGGPDLQEMVKSWASPTAHDGRRPGPDPNSTQDRNLQREAASWSTPKARDERSAEGETGLKRNTPDLNVQAKTWATPKAVDGIKPSAGSRRSSDLSHQAQTTPDGGPSSNTTPTSRPRLNPAFVCWLMGVPWWWTRAERISFASQEMESWLSRARSLLPFLLKG